jgi:hypothetical protein
MYYISSRIPMSSGIVEVEPPHSNYLPLYSKVEHSRILMSRGKIEP